jgi:CubicO group peptidase (beta-lactamase class C family)
MKDLEGAFARLDQFVARNMDALNAPGIAMALTDREKLLRLSTFGFADVAAQVPVRPETLFEIGSIGKSFACVVLLQLRQEGLLDGSTELEVLHEPVTRYLPWFRVQSRYAPITLHHLMSHTAGIGDGTDGVSTLAEVWAMREMETTAPPGTFFHYSNVGYKALGLVLERVLGQPIDEIYRQRIFKPLGMHSSEPTVTHDVRRRLAVGYGAFYDDRPLPRGGLLAPATWLECDSADGSISSNAADMAAYLRMLLNRGQGPQGRLLSEEGFALLTQRIIRPDDDLPDQFYGYGLDVGEVDGRTYIGHDGGMVGYVTTMQANLDDSLGVVVLTNGPSDPDVIGRYALELLRAARHGQELPALPEAIDPLWVEDAAQYTGTYRAGERALVLVSQGERLFLQYGDERLPLEQIAPGNLYTPHPDLARFPLRFGRQEDGRVVEVFHGADWYTSERYAGPTNFEHPPEWHAYVGHYASYNPWLTNLRVVLRKGALVLIFPDGNEELLTPLGGGAFRVGADERSPERMRFDTIVEGRAVCAYLSGGAYYRTFTP